MIDNCPKCDYALAGLPDQYRCPECGTNYDREAVAFPDNMGVAKVALVVNLLMALSFGAVYWKFGDHRLARLLVILLLFVGVLAWLIKRKARTNGIYVSPRMIQVVRDSEVQTFEMHPVATAAGSMVDGHIYLYNSAGIEIARISTRSMLRVRKIAAQIRAFTSDGKPEPAQ